MWWDDSTPASASGHSDSDLSGFNKYESHGLRDVGVGYGKWEVGGGKT